MIHTVLFDVGGVLHNSEQEHIRRDIVKTLGITHAQHDAAVEELVPLLQTGKITEQAFWKKFIALTSAPKPLPKESLWAREFERRYSIFGDMLRLAQSLKAAGARIAVLSNTIEAHAKINRRKGIYVPFQEIILSHEVGFAKPDPKIYQLALERLQAAPQETVFIDDQHENIAAAAALGINGILFESTQQGADALNLVR